MNPEQRRKRAAELADEINSDVLLQDDLKFLLTQHTVYRLTTQASFVMNFDNFPRPQFVGA